MRSNFSYSRIADSDQVYFTSRFIFISPTQFFTDVESTNIGKAGENMAGAVIPVLHERH